MTTFSDFITQIPAKMTLHDCRTDQRLNCADFLTSVNACHIDPDQRGPVVIALSSPIDCLVALFSTWKAGRCAVLVNPNIKPDEQARIAAKTGATLWIDATEQKLLHPEDPAKAGLEDAALILMTSGTTGDPKGITHSLQTLQDRIMANLDAIGRESLQNTLCTLPLFFGHGLIGNTLTAMFAGATVHLWPSLRIDEMPGFGGKLDELGITFFSSVPSFWKMILATSARPTHGPARVHVGSAPLSLELWREICRWCGTDAVFNTYGMTETANWIAGGTLSGAAGDDGYVGQPWGGRFALARDGALHDSGEGEVAVQSPGLMLGLWEDAEGTMAAIPDGWLRTGDIGRLDPDQNLWLIGRSKHEINVGGIKVLAEEVDLLLERHPGVAEACAFGMPDPIAGERVAAIARVTDPDLSPQDVIAWCRDQVRADAVPARLEVVNDIPKNDRGKIARMDIRERMLAAWS